MALDLAAKIAKSPSAQKKIKAAIQSEMEKYGAYLAHCTETVAPSHGSIDFTGAPETPTVEGSGLHFTATSGINYDHAGAMRDTMSTRKAYPRTDMILNFNYGWNARDQIIEGDLKSRVTYAGDYFAEDAAAMFNAGTPAGVTATVTMGEE